MQRYLLGSDARRDKIKRASKSCQTLGSLSPQRHPEEYRMATQSYRERLKAQRAEARAKREGREG